MSAPRDDGWFESEERTRETFVRELQRLYRRARARWPYIVVIAALLTAGVLYKRSKKVTIHNATVVLAASEGSMSDGHHPMPALELHSYLDTVLLSNGVLLELIEEEDLFPLRHKLGDEFAISELRGMFEVGVFRNYFLYQYTQDARRSARISIDVWDADPDFAWWLAHRLANLIVEGEHARRLEIAEHLGQEVELALSRARAEVDALEATMTERNLALAAAERANDEGQVAALTVETIELSARLHRQREAVLALVAQGSSDAMALAIDRAGLGMTFEVAEEDRPFEQPGARLYFQVILGGIVFCVLLPVVAIFVGAFDSRIHDGEDVVRIGLPVIGHVPPFPGDRVGSLRARGVRGRRVPS